MNDSEPQPKNGPTEVDKTESGMLHALDTLPFRLGIVETPEMLVIRPQLIEGIARDGIESMLPMLIEYQMQGEA